MLDLNFLHAIVMPCFLSDVEGQIEETVNDLFAVSEAGSLFLLYTIP